MKVTTKIIQTIIGTVAVLGASSLQAQIGSNWSEYFPTKQYHGGVSQSQRYSISGNVEHFWVYDTDPHFSSNDSGPRSEWKVNNDYSSGSQQFQGDANPEHGTAAYTAFQIFGSTTQATSIQLQIRDGDLKRYNEEILAAGVWGVYTRVNILHYCGPNQIEAWINGSKKGTFADGGDVSHYFKYGCYDTASASSYTGIYWRGARFFSGGNSQPPIDTTAQYQLQNMASGLVLNNQGSLTNGSKITQWSSVSSDNLRWTFIPTDSGYYEINSVKSGKDAVVQSASTSAGAGIIQYSFGSAQNDQWKPTQNSDGSFTFVNRHSGLVLEDPASSTSTSTQMDQWTANGGANQKWKLIKQ